MLKHVRNWTVIKVMVSEIACPETVRSVNDNLQTTPSVLNKMWISRNSVTCLKV